MALRKKTAAMKRPSPRCTRASLRFWLKQLEDGVVMTAIWRHPVRARRFFGAVPVVRRDINQLWDIANAHKFLWSSDCEVLRPMRRLRRAIARATREEAKATGKPPVLAFDPDKSCGSYIGESELLERLRRMAVRVLKDALE